MTEQRTSTEADPVTRSKISKAIKKAATALAANDRSSGATKPPTARAVLDQSVSEKQLQAAIVALAQLKGWRCYHTYDSRRSAAGFPDLLCLRGARAVAMEIKRERGRPTMAQVEWLDSLRLAGFGTYIIRPSDWSNGTVEAVLA